MRLLFSFPYRRVATSMPFSRGEQFSFREELLESRNQSEIFDFNCRRYVDASAQLSFALIAFHRQEDNLIEKINLIESRSLCKILFRNRVGLLCFNSILHNIFCLHSFI